MSDTTKIKDYKGTTVKVGDLIALEYVTPYGGATGRYLEDYPYKVLFRFGALCIATSTKYIPLIDYVETKQGDYVSNAGYKVKYDKKGRCSFKILSGCMEQSDTKQKQGEALLQLDESMKPETSGRGVQ